LENIMQSTQREISGSARTANLIAVRTEAAHVHRRSGSAPRPDLYGFVHKGLRAFLSDTLSRCGRMDADDDGDVAETLAQVRGLIELCRAHLTKEEAYMHRAMEARCPGTARQSRDDHAAHLQAFEDIEANVRAVEQAHGADRAATALQLYRALALFVADNLEHMHVEETGNNEVLWATHTNEELLALQEQIVGSIPPAEMQAFLRWMIPAMAPAERALMLGGIKQKAPGEVFTMTMMGLKPHLAERDWNKLMAALAGL
jgi:iron-sulfur cluster repair protein YtfE (RIC family)